MAFWDIGGIISGVGRLWGSIFGSKETTEKDTSKEKTMAQQIAIADAMGAARRTDFFTAFVDGLNRLVRPTFSYGVIAYFVWATVDPVGFTVSMQALAIIPDFMYGIFLTIVGFWFGGRILEKYADAKLKGPSAELLNEVLSNQKKILAGHGGSVIVNKSVDVPNDKPKASAPVVRHNVTMEPIYEDDEKRPTP
jgi:hypothetical protein